MASWEKINGLIAKAFALIGGAAISLMALNILADALLRTFLTTTIPGTLEYVQYYWMVLVAFGGWALAQHTGQHIDAPIISDNLQPRHRLIWKLWAEVLTVIYLVILIYFSWQAALHAFNIGEYQGGYNTPIWPTRFFIPAAALAMLLVVLHHLVGTITRLVKFDAEAEMKAATQDEALSDL